MRQAQLALAAAEAAKARPAAAKARRSGSDWLEGACCCCWLWRVLPAISRIFCSVSVWGVKLPTVPDLCRKSQTWKEVALHSSPSIGPAGPAGAAQEEYLLLPFGPAGATLEDHLA